ncbi:MAG: polymer-forming cytoskeletal protein [Lentimicrobiaceae bacterium]|jgi:cytoskeletal protein CcmA (bactofilin family)|nr:polymer-forming cytoskeletal protein [Lentimicrobiaceae bacterium]
MAKQPIPEPPSINIIGSGTVINGSINSNGDMRIDGTLIGTITSTGKVIVGTTGNVEGEIMCQNADFSGIVKAKVAISELLSLKASAHLSGDVITNKIAIEPGARFTGSCRMETPATGGEKTFFNEQSQPEKEETA